MTSALPESAKLNGKIQFLCQRLPRPRQAALACRGLAHRSLQPRLSRKATPLLPRGPGGVWPDAAWGPAALTAVGPYLRQRPRERNRWAPIVSWWDPRWSRSATQTSSSSLGPGCQRCPSPSTTFPTSASQAPCLLKSTAIPSTNTDRQRSSHRARGHSVLQWKSQLLDFKACSRHKTYVCDCRMSSRVETTWTTRDFVFPEYIDKTIFYLTSCFLFAVTLKVYMMSHLTNEYSTVHQGNCYHSWIS